MTDDQHTIEMRRYFLEALERAVNAYLAGPSKTETGWGGWNGAIDGEELAEERAVLEPLAAPLWQGDDPSYPRDRPRT